MSKYLKKIIFSIVLFSSINSNFATERYTIDFKKQKKHIDTLTFLNPYVHIVTYKGIDSSVINYDSNTITSMVYGLLFKKYKLMNYAYHNLDFSTIDSKMLEIDSKKGPIIGASVDTFINKLDKKINSRYALLVLCRGTFNPDFEPDYDVKFAFTNNVILINSPAKVYMEMAVVIIDTYKKEIIYFNNNSSTSHDPRKDDDVKLTTQNLLEWFY